MVDQKNNFSGFESEVKIVFKSQLLFLGVGYAKSIPEARIEAAKDIILDFIDEIEAKELRFKIEASETESTIINLWKILEENGTTTMNPTTELNALITKTWKRGPIVEQKQKNKVYTCRLILPCLDTPLTTEGEARSAKDAQEKASKAMLLKLGPYLINHKENERRKAKEQEQNFKRAVGINQKIENMSKLRKEQNENLLNNTPVKSEVKIETKEEFKENNVPVNEESLEVDFTKEKNVVSFVNGLISQRYKTIPSIKFNQLENKDYECNFSFNLEGKTISGVGVARKKSDAKKIASERLMEQLPIHHTHNPVEPKQRDNCYKILLSKHFKTLSNDHELELQKRFLCPKLAEKLCLRSWYKKEISFTKELDPLIPGLREGLGNVRVQGFQTTGRKGIFIPAFTPDGMIVGAQIKPNKIKTTEKYVFLSSKAFGGYPINLPNNDLPLYCWTDPKIFENQTPNEKQYKQIKDIIAPKGIGELSSPNVLGLCEGSLKPLVAAYRLQIPFIGSAGMNFIQSGETLKKYLAEIKPKNIIIFPDAGAVSNKHILVSYFETIVLLYKGGNKYNLKVAWYEQHDKIRDNDVDEMELDDVKNFQLLTPLEFFEKTWSDCKSYIENKVRNIDCIKKNGETIEFTKLLDLKNKNMKITTDTFTTTVPIKKEMVEIIDLSDD